MDIGEFHLLNVFTGPQALGNPCAVVRVSELADTNMLARMAKDLCAPATAFVSEVHSNSASIRWFGPEGEIQFCGHGALGAGWVLLDNSAGPLTLKSALRSVELSRDGTTLRLRGDAVANEALEVPENVQRGFHHRARAYFQTGDKDIVLLPDAKSVREMTPDYQALRESQVFGYAITAEGEDCDFVSRVLRVHLREPEDTATGSAHLALAPFWSKRLNKARLQARQLSARGGWIGCELEGERVTLLAQCEPIGQGRLTLKP